MIVKCGLVVIALLASVADKKGDLVRTLNSREVAGSAETHASTRVGGDPTSLSSSGH